MPSLRDYHILISHSWDYSSDYETIKRWLDEAPNFMWTNYSVPLTNPLDVNGKRELKEKLRNRISLCSCVIILSGMYVSYSEWIDYEIDTAIELGKPIIGVKPRGQVKVKSFAPRQIQRRLFAALVTLSRKVFRPWHKWF